MKPDRTNYEIWLIDYLDGRLDENQIRLLHSFLNENPDIKEEFEIVSQPDLQYPASFRNKDLLKKSVSDLPGSQFEMLCIAESENDLGEEQRTELYTILDSDPGKKTEFDLIQKLKLTPPDVKYKNKSSLKRLTISQKVVRYSIAGISIAAGIALFFAVSRLTGEQGPESGLAVSVKTPDLQFVTSPSKKNPDSENKREEIKEKKVDSKISVKKTLIFSGISGNPGPAVKSTGNELIEETKESRPVYIAKAGFIEDVRIPGETFSGSLAELTPNKITYTEVPESPGLNGYLAKVIRLKILKSKTPETGSLKAYEVADAGIIGLNKLLGWDMSLKQTRDEKGDLRSLYFSSKIIKFNAPVKKYQAAL